ncbi:DUF2493 domain-containing protein [Pseudomonas gingeri]|uniref:DUF2493 domain-containing protein n=1 Tax=Pseudomonas gingeri TaxID=117681 RepID=A0A7Y7YCC7_9PSED|nr:DUF2493 domain-containing protein [Pseudomonas gingeri]NVZ99610.1 DUF2493 domain-containing protein [Pseudomonas gingeri]NWA15368.1 DUF2493 domain-containing protein [Pseudomonas gingeri]NWA56595.1 DUF2493 domain-containing protein [Pseudomonas gingeri]NWA95089.1 DUF2493 domain-containing protein [Pseudomonas gingeri]NWB05171.1 DUF2493 domain-containing protein [Pseudomonas gingeri]
MRVLICAGRYYMNASMCRKVLEAYQQVRRIEVLIHGGNQYLGSTLEDWARETGTHIVRYPSNWQLYGKQAERRRNQFMLLDSEPDLVLAFPGGNDTEELVAQARAIGIETLPIDD